MLMVEINSDHGIGCGALCFETYPFIRQNNWQQDMFVCGYLCSGSGGIAIHVAVGSIFYFSHVMTDNWCPVTEVTDVMMIIGEVVCWVFRR